MANFSRGKRLRTWLAVLGAGALLTPSVLYAQQTTIWQGPDDPEEPDFEQFNDFRWSIGDNWSDGVPGPDDIALFSDQHPDDTGELPLNFSIVDQEQFEIAGLQFDDNAHPFHMISAEFPEEGQDPPSNSLLIGDEGITNTSDAFQLIGDQQGQFPALDNVQLTASQTWAGSEENEDDGLAISGFDTSLILGQEDDQHTLTIRDMIVQVGVSITGNEDSHLRIESGGDLFMIGDNDYQGDTILAGGQLTLGQTGALPEASTLIVEQADQQSRLVAELTDAEMTAVQVPADIQLEDDLLLQTTTPDEDFDPPTMILQGLIADAPDAQAGLILDDADVAMQAQNTYTGQTLLQAGSRLVLDEDASLASDIQIDDGQFHLAEGATAASVNLTEGQVSGSGLISGSLTTQGGRVAPGSSIGTLRVDDDINLGGGTDLAIDFRMGETPGIQEHDLLLSENGDITFQPDVSISLNQTDAGEDGVTQISGGDSFVLAEAQNINLEDDPQISFDSDRVTFVGELTADGTGFRVTAMIDEENIVLAARNAYNAPLRSAIRANQAFNANVVTQLRRSAMRRSGQTAADAGAADMPVRLASAQTDAHMLAQATPAATGWGDGDNDTQPTWSIFATPYGVWDNVDPDEGDDIRGHRADTAGILLGLEAVLHESISVGVVTAYAYTDYNLRGNQGGGQTHTGRAGPFLSFEHEGFHLDALATYGYHDNTIRRRLDQDRTRGKYQAEDLAAHLSVGYDLALADDTTIATPIGALDYTHYHHGTVRESGDDDSTVTASNRSFDALESTLGLRLQQYHETDWGAWQPEFFIGWSADLLNDDDDLRARAASGENFRTDATSPSRHAFRAGGGIMYDYGNDFSVGASFDTRQQSGGSTYAGNLTFEYRF